MPPQVTQVFFTNLTGTKFGTGNKITGTGKKITGTGKKMSGVDVPSARVHEPSKGVVEIFPVYHAESRYYLITYLFLTMLGATLCRLKGCTVFADVLQSPCCSPNTWF